jgi:hypothetical protein
VDSSLQQFLYFLVVKSDEKVFSVVLMAAPFVRFFGLLSTWLALAGVTEVVVLFTYCLSYDLAMRRLGNLDWFVVTHL